MGPVEKRPEQRLSPDGAELSAASPSLRLAGSAVRVAGLALAAALLWHIAQQYGFSYSDTMAAPGLIPLICSILFGLLRPWGVASDSRDRVESLVICVFTLAMILYTSLEILVASSRAVGPDAHLILRSLAVSLAFVWMMKQDARKTASMPSEVQDGQQPLERDISASAVTRLWVYRAIAVVLIGVVFSAGQAEGFALQSQQQLRDDDLWTLV